MVKKILGIVAILILLLCSCSTTKYIEVPVETVRKEYVYNTRIDSVCVKDSVDRYIQGDTVYQDRWHTEYRYESRTDTVCKTDSIPKIIEKEVLKEMEVNHIYWYQQTLMWIGGVAVLISTGYIIYKVKFK